jgi:hypothetical protein
MKSTIFTLDRRFGFLLGAAFTVLAYRAQHLGWPPSAGWLCAAGAAAFALAAILAPNVLAPLTAAWMKLGQLLGKVISPIVLGFIFFVIITPVAVAMRLAGRDALNLKSCTGKSHWIERIPPGPEGCTFKNQY